MKERFDVASFKTSKLVTNAYSTSFSLGIMLLGKSIKKSIYSIYGFVRYADEIVDSFEGYNQKELLCEFIDDYHKALKREISLNPVLNSFQKVVNMYQIHSLVDDFLESMKKDLGEIKYSTEEEYKQYIYGSADVVGLMCLKVFVHGDESKYKELKPYAEKLGSAFQKVNFLRDFSDDFKNLGRSYFPNIQCGNIDHHTKQEIIEDIKEDFSQALIGIQKLPNNCKFGVYVAYTYYLSLLRKISLKKPEEILQSRIRIPNYRKVFLLVSSYFRYKINVL